MSILNRKRRIKCSVQLTIQELLSVPFINGILFCKLRLVEGGSFTAYSSKKEILHSSVFWNFDINFEVKIQSNLLNPELYEPCICRISVRKELRGGKSYQKLGYIDYNLSDYINKCETINRVLKEYDTKNRLDNSLLKVKIKLNEIDPQQQQQQQQSKKTTIPQISNNKSLQTQAFCNNVNLNLNTITSSSISSTGTNTSSSASSSPSSTTTTIKNFKNNNHNNDDILMNDDFLINNQNNKIISSSHSRNPSKSSAISSEKGHQRNISNSSTTSTNSYDTTTRSKNKKLIEELQAKDADIRIIETRIDPYEIINQIENELAIRKNIDQKLPAFTQQQKQQQQQQQEKNKEQFHNLKNH